MPKIRLKFNQKLISYFFETAQPYFFPINNNQTWVFCTLLVTLIVMIISLTYFITIGATLLTNTVFTNFSNIITNGFIGKINRTLDSKITSYVAIILLASSLIFLSQFSKIGKKWKQWFLLGSLLFLLLVVNGLRLIMSYVFRFIDTALTEKNADVFWQFMIVYGLVLISAVPIIIIYRYTRKKLGLMWRKWLTKHFLSRYFSYRVYYKLNSEYLKKEVDNPDQRITQDIKSFTIVTLDFLLDFFNSILTLVSFSYILYTISDRLTYGLLVYAIFGTTVVLIAGNRLIKINYAQLRLEANFRHSILRIRDYAESIAFYRGEFLENKQVTNKLKKVVKNFNLLIIWQSIINLFQLGYNYFTRLIPYIMIAPLYLKGELDFGSIAQATVAFSQVLEALSLITNRIPEITKFAASINRLGEFYESMNPGLLQEEELNSDLIHIEKFPVIILQNVSLYPPNSQRKLVKNITVRVDKSNNLLIMGTSGTGKSSLLRAIAGLWTSGSGTIFRPSPKEILFLPQHPYMISGSLKEQLLYPDMGKYITQNQLDKILVAVDLQNLRSRFQDFDIRENWSSVLSLGEQQRIAFARILITKPRYVILDEATSALDEENEESLYHSLSTSEISYISVGHRPTLTKYHQQILTIMDEGNWELETHKIYS
ncbi:ABC transporter ATP-binding protein/permease [Candidatus Atelocyanobacterium thalassae]|uniref:ABC transporter ATP-binding protein n=1 Tax=cyanobacterium endosymbiont of Braarudosphaera bigelowii TaxID=1285375 RepID=A0ABM7U5V8_9CHRO|nr:ABC transporter ATP-binding protein/permease [Candidatus Atelocyanobacterium thalassa]BDA39763.1 hypothetical protein CPARK_000060300 [cyanobacterium endosymbiont of Braarudosphaera bigelowii]